MERRRTLRLLSMACAAAWLAPPAAPAAAPARATGPVRLTAGQTQLLVGSDGGAFIQVIRVKQGEIVREGGGRPGSSLSVTAGGDGSAESLFANRPVTPLAPSIESLATEGSAAVVKGGYVGKGIRVPFVRRIALEADGRRIAVREETDYSALPAGTLVAGHRLSLPLVVDKDPHLRMFALGGARRVELFRMDMNDVNRGGKQLISAPRGHWPYWDLAGVEQRPGSYRLWKANHADTMAYPLESGDGAPGWADYSEPAWGITCVVDDPAECAPWSIVIDARQGEVAVQPRPATALPAAGRDLGKRTFAFRLLLHETSWPAMHPCELPLETYRALLKDIAQPGGRPTPWMLYRTAGTDDIDSIAVRQRIQPSIMLRSLYRGDAYLMQGRMRDIGIQRPRNQSMARWEADAKVYLEHLRTHGLPARKRP